MGFRCQPVGALSRIYCKILALVELSRPYNCLIAASGTYVGYWLLAPPDARAWLAFAVVFLLCAGGNAINDYFDRNIDLKTKPHRPIPSGRISSGTALAYSFLLFSLSILIAMRINFQVFALAGASTVLLAFYSGVLKRWKLAGNFVVSLVVAMTFIFSEAASGIQGITRILAYCAFSSNIAREIIKDISDIRAREQNSLPKLIGRKPSAMFAMFWLALAMLVGLVTALNLRSVWFTLFMLGGYASFITAMIRLFVRQDYMSSVAAQNLIKVGMILVLVAFVSEKLLG